MTTDPDHPERIVISADDLDDAAPPDPRPAPPTPPPEGAAPTPSTSKALPPMTRGAAPPPPGAAPPKPAGPLPPGGALPGLPAQPKPMQIGKPGVAAPVSLATLGANSIVAGLVAGLLGGAVGAVVAEVLKNPENSTATSDAAIRLDAGVWVAIFGAVLGFTLQAWEGITSSSFEKAGRDGLRGLGIGAVAGFIGGYVAQWLYAEMTKNAFESGTDPTNALLVARVVGWAIFGAIAGLGMGIPSGQKKAVNGVIGGALGGAVGGFMFEKLASSGAFDSGFMLRLVGLIATGAGIGLGVGIVDRLRRDAWLRFTDGPMAGKEFILFKDVTTVGTDYRCDIVLAKDETVLPRHVSLQKDARGMTTVSPEPGASITVNGSPVAQQRLRSGDTIGVGRSSLQFQERAATG